MFSQFLEHLSSLKELTDCTVDGISAATAFLIPGPLKINSANSVPGKW